MVFTESLDCCGQEEQLVFLAELFPVDHLLGVLHNGLVVARNLEQAEEKLGVGQVL